MAIIIKNKKHSIFITTIIINNKKQHFHYDHLYQQKTTISLRPSLSSVGHKCPTLNCLLHIAGHYDIGTDKGKFYMTLPTPRWLGA
jgi:hypothetical protein